MRLIHFLNHQKNNYLSPTFFFSSRRRHTRWTGDWSSDVCSSDLRGESRQFWPEMVGFKYKMSNLQAAIGCAQLERIEELVKTRRNIFAYYHERLRDLPLRMNPEPPGTINGYWMPTIVVEEATHFGRAELLQRFLHENIDGRVFFWPLTMLSMFSTEHLNHRSY